ncbi:hypothetical protein [Dyadobacter tibetensis]|uniref:hypothetical protein n=1 Tax=Dyadobacter tibetensis TaxID=1211851 RepID=UPI00046E6723|nr:hypothetical protein [Dyadobacter tibetensis]
MTHEKILKRKDNTSVKISVWLYVYQNESRWGYLVFIKEPGTDIWLDPFAYQRYKALSEGKPMDDLAVHQFASEEEIYRTKMELWRKIQPV